MSQIYSMKKTSQRTRSKKRKSRLNRIIFRRNQIKVKSLMVEAKVKKIPGRKFGSKLERKGKVETKS